MFRVVTPEEMKRIEERGTQLGISYRRMMENAGSAAAAFIDKTLWAKGRRCLVLCGKGNNGGDGFAAARRLAQRGALVTVVLTDGLPKTMDSADMLAALEPVAIPALSLERDGAEIRSLLSSADIIVDAVYGSGFYGQLPEHHRAFFREVNQAIAAIVSLDIPSGVSCGGVWWDPDSIRADFTLAFDSLKPAHLFRREIPVMGDIHVLDIGIPKEAHAGLGESFTDWDDARFFEQVREKDPASHKNSNGRLLNLAGSLGMTGAAVLSTRGALACGTGYVTLATPEEVYPLAAAHLVTPVFLPLADGKEEAAVASALGRATAVCAGCGMGHTPRTTALVELLLRKARCPLVLDADALNCLSDRAVITEGQRRINMLCESKAPLILTPHLGEFARLAGVSIREVRQNRLGLAMEFAKAHGCVLALKSADTLAVSPEGRAYVNQTGNPGLAKAGSGDVLAGMIAAFAAQGVPAFEAAVCGVYLHGLAGDRCAERLSQYSMLPTDLMEDICGYFRENKH